jgi:hypothetical protein
LKHAHEFAVWLMAGAEKSGAGAQTSVDGVLVGIPVKPVNNEPGVLISHPLEFNACAIIHSGSESDGERVQSFAFLKEVSGYA